MVGPVDLRSGCATPSNHTETRFRRGPLELDALPAVLDRRRGLAPARPVARRAAVGADAPEHRVRADRRRELPAERADDLGAARAGHLDEREVRPVGRRRELVDLQPQPPPEASRPGAGKSVTRRNAVPLPSVCTCSTLPARRSRSTCSVPCLVSMPQSRLAAPPTGSASKSSQNSAVRARARSALGSGCRPPSGLSGGRRRRGDGDERRRGDREHREPRRDPGPGLRPGLRPGHGHACPPATWKVSGPRNLGGAAAAAANLKRLAPRRSDRRARVAAHASTTGSLAPRTEIADGPAAVSVSSQSSRPSGRPPARRGHEHRPVRRAAALW